MGSDAVKAYGAVRRGKDIVLKEPETLVVVTDESHPSFDPRRTIDVPAFLVDSVGEHGVMEPVEVYKDGADKKGVPIVEVVDGNMRVLAARLANVRRKKAGLEPILVPCLPWRGDDVDRYERTIVHNEHRVESDPVTKAKTAQKFLDKGATKARVARAFRWSDETLRRHLAILSCAPVVQDALRRGDVPVARAPDFATMPRAEQEKSFREMKEAGALRGRKGEEEIKRRKNGHAPARKLTRREIALRAVESLPKKLDFESRAFFAAVRWMLGEDEALAGYDEAASILKVEPVVKERAS